MENPLLFKANNKTLIEYFSIKTMKYLNIG